MISCLISDTFYYVFLGLALIYFLQRRGGAEKKRKATLLWGGAVFALTVVGMLVERSPEYAGRQLSQAVMILAIVIVAVVLAINRRHLWPFAFRCPLCGERLGWSAWLNRDTNLCDRCAAEIPPASAADRP